MSITLQLTTPFAATGQISIRGVKRQTLKINVCFKSTNISVDHKHDFYVGTMYIWYYMYSYIYYYVSGVDVAGTPLLARGRARQLF